MTTLELEIAIMRYFDIKQNLIVPCITDMSLLTLFEIDMLVLSKSSYCTAVELKISKADLKNDLKKKHIKCTDHIKFNSVLKEHYYKNIKHFYYAVPEFLQEDALKQIPSFAGLLVCKKIDWYNTGQKSSRIVLVRESKIINKKKWTDSMRANLSRLGSMRILGLKERINNLINNN